METDEDFMLSVTDPDMIAIILLDRVSFVSKGLFLAEDGYYRIEGNSFIRYANEVDLKHKGYPINCGFGVLCDASYLDDGVFSYKFYRIPGTTVGHLTKRAL